MDFWIRDGFLDHETTMAMAVAELPFIEEHYGAPRDLDVARAYLGRRIRTGRILLYGAGTHTQQLLEAGGLPGVTIVGIIDRFADKIGSRYGLDVVPPERLDTFDYDHIVISHSSYEREMRDTLLSVGVAAERIISIYSDPEYRQMAEEAYRPHWEAIAAQSKSFIVVSCSDGMIISDETLSAMLGRDDVAFFYLGREPYKARYPDDPTIDLRESFTGLKEIIRMMGARAVYLRTIVYKNHLGLFLKSQLPDLRVVHECYDFNTTWNDYDLKGFFGIDDRSLRMLRLSEYYGAHRFDAILSKRDGEHWGSFVRLLTVPYLVYFPRLDPFAVWEPPVLPVASSGICYRIAYAGAVPTPTFVASYTAGYNFMPVIEALCASGEFSADIYNANHLNHEFDSLFQSYLDRYAVGPVRYHRRMPYDAMTAALRQAHFGWLCGERYEFQLDRLVLVSNTAAGYIDAGLPLLVDRGWGLLVELVERFNAGVVVEGTDPDIIAARISAAPPHAELAAGMAALRNHLAGRNRGTCEALIRLMDADPVEHRPDPAQSLS